MRSELRTGKTGDSSKTNWAQGFSQRTSITSCLRGWRPAGDVRVYSDTPQSRRSNSKNVCVQLKKNLRASVPYVATPANRRIPARMLRSAAAAITLRGRRTNRSRSYLGERRVGTLPWSLSAFFDGASRRGCRTLLFFQGSLALGAISPVIYSARAVAARQDQRGIYAPPAHHEADMVESRPAPVFGQVVS